MVIQNANTVRAIIQTASNYRGLNGQSLQVMELAGKRVSCRVYDADSNKFIIADFTLSEIQEFISI